MAAGCGTCPGCAPSHHRMLLMQQRRWRRLLPLFTSWLLLSLLLLLLLWLLLRLPEIFCGCQLLLLLFCQPTFHGGKWILGRCQPRRSR